MLSARRERRATFCSVLLLSELDLIRVEDDDGKGQPSHGEESESVDGNVGVLSYLKQENHYTHSIMSGTTSLSFILLVLSANIKY